MPWEHGQPYIEEKNAELRHLLILRHLPHSGNKEKMVSRLVAHDRNHPFPFQKLPAELRNEVYRLVSISQDFCVTEGLQSPSRGHTEGSRCSDSFQIITSQSALFRACKQTRAEGLAMFFRNHVFVICVEHSGCFLAILQWLDNIGDIGRQNIRHLHIRFLTKCAPVDVGWMDDIHTKLSDRATVVYIPKRARSLWKIGEQYYQNDPHKAPLFKIDGLEAMPTLLQWADKETRDYTTPPFWRQLAPYNHLLLYTMEFKPG